MTLPASFSEPSSRKMDVFPSIESTNNVLVKAVAAFNKVEDSINQNSFDVANQIRRLPVSESWNDREEDEGFGPNVIAFHFIMTVLTTVLVMAMMLVSYWLLCKTLQDFLTQR